MAPATCRDAVVDAAPVEFFPFPEVPRDAVETATRIVQAARLDVGGIEYLETPDGRRVFYDINANSNLRPSVAAAFGFDPFERVVDFLISHLSTRTQLTSATYPVATIPRSHRRSLLAPTRPEATIRDAAPSER